MPTRLCDRCGQLIEEGALRYIAKIQVFAAYDPLNVDFEDATRDHTNEIREILKRCEDLTEEELMQDVYVDFQFDLCRGCQRTYIKDPLPAAEGAGGAA
jgi:hypothetical protein